MLDAGYSIRPPVRQKRQIRNGPICMFGDSLCGAIENRGSRITGGERLSGPSPDVQNLFLIRINRRKRLKGLPAGGIRVGQRHGFR